MPAAQQQQNNTVPKHCLFKPLAYNTQTRRVLVLFRIEHYPRQPYTCSSCNTGYKIVNYKCYKNCTACNGLCWLTSGQVSCTCYAGSSGKTCTECAGEVLDGVCYTCADEERGTRCTHPTDPKRFFYTRCAHEYALPDCTRCSTGYAYDIDYKCTQCDSGFAPDLGAACVATCASCMQSDCGYSADKILCDACAGKHMDPQRGCTKCADDSIAYGSYCLIQSGADQIPTEPALPDVVTVRCAPERQSFNCSKCSIGGTFADTCRVRSTVLPQMCYEDAETARCEADAECLVVSLETGACTQCPDGSLNANGWCYRQIMSRAVSARRGTCYESTWLGNTFCTECETGWMLPDCVLCAGGFLPCGENDMECCPEVDGHNGRCYTNNGKVTCATCADGYVLSGGRCERRKGSKTLMIFWICFGCLLVLCAVILTAIYFTRSRYAQMVLRRKTLRTLQKIGNKVLFTALAQAVALIIAMQDVYIGSFHMQIAVNLASSAPFFLLFGFLSFPKFRGFQVGHWGDVPLFLSGALLEAAFLLIHYYLIPETFGFSETFYKLSAPPVALVMFVLAARMKYTRMQIGGFFIALAFPILLYVVQTISESLGMYYFNADSYGSVLVGFLCVVAIELVLSCQYYITDMVLGKYDEFASVLRLASAQFLVAVAFFACAPQPCLDAMSNLGPFLFCFLTQIVVNVLSVVIMSNLTVMEYQINIITSAVWVQLIESAGEMRSAVDNNINISASRLVLSCFQLAFVIVGLTVFVAFANSFFDLHNECRNNCEKENYVTVLKLSKYLNHQRSKFNAADIEEIYAVEMVLGSAQLATSPEIALLEDTEDEKLCSRSIRRIDSQSDNVLGSSRILARANSIHK